MSMTSILTLDRQATEALLTLQARCARTYSDTRDVRLDGDASARAFARQRGGGDHLTYVVSNTRQEIAAKEAAAVRLYANCRQQASGWIPRLQRDLSAVEAAVNRARKARAVLLAWLESNLPYWVGDADALRPVDGKKISYTPLGGEPAQPVGEANAALADWVLQGGPTWLAR
ncbi:MAG TPA: hypothetical protein VFB38_17165 [Chthonomonadaceae bacterium]|nr:hypothetical protein [Chthonomonadaceae bacterium]